MPNKVLKNESQTALQSNHKNIEMCSVNRVNVKERAQTENRIALSSKRTNDSPRHLVLHSTFVHV